jgi:hypothetical protein
MKSLAMRQPPSTLLVALTPGLLRFDRNLPAWMVANHGKE